MKSGNRENPNKLFHGVEFPGAVSDFPESARTTFLHGGKL